MKPERYPLDDLIRELETGEPTGTPRQLAERHELHARLGGDGMRATIVPAPYNPDADEQGTEYDMGWNEGFKSAGSWRRTVICLCVAMFALAAVILYAVRH